MRTSTSKATGPTSPSLRTDASQSGFERLGHATPTLSVVLPVYNEVENIPVVFEELVDALDGLDGEYFDAEVIFVEDGSTDGTDDLIDLLAARNAFVSAIHLRRSWGQSAALAAGFDAANGDVIVSMDCDQQNDPADIPALLEEMERTGADCVSGYRKNRDDPLSKRVPSRIQTTLAKTTGPQINDFGCTLKAYRREALDDIQLYGEGHRYIPAQLHDKGYTVTELEVNHRPRVAGESRYGVGRLVRGFVDLLFAWFWVRYSTRPIHLLGGSGLAFLGAGVALGTVSLVQKYAFGVPLDPRTPRLILIALLVIFGLQLVVFGVLAEMQTRLLYRDDTEYRIERVVR